MLGKLSFLLVKEATNNSFLPLPLCVFIKKEEGLKNPNSLDKKVLQMFRNLNANEIYIPTIGGPSKRDTASTVSIIEYASPRNFKPAIVLRQGVQHVCTMPSRAEYIQIYAIRCPSVVANSPRKQVKPVKNITSW